MSEALGITLSSLRVPLRDPYLSKALSVALYSKEWQCRVKYLNT
jgi:hypothetical protein